jgi:hypothetical protein
MISNQSLTCPKGTSLTFEIDMDTGSDLTGATAQWALAESWFDQAKVYLTKTGVSDGLFIGQDAGIWKITINLAPSDTLDVPSGLLYHDCKVLLQNGDVEDVANGPFVLDPSVNVLNTNAPSTRNLRSVPQPLASIGQTATGTVGVLARNLQGTQTFGSLGQTAAATSGGITWVGPTWSLTDHDSRIDISGSNNQTATHNALGSSPHPSAKSEESQTTGQRYVEFHIDLVSGGELVSVGIGNGAAPISGLAAGMDTSSNSVGYSSAGNVWYNGGFASINGDANLPSFTTGDVIGMLIDLDANTLKFRKNGGAYSATMSITAMRPSSDPIFVICTLDAISSITSNGVTLINI